MLSAKQTRVHGMRNEKWSTREKNSQYRAILKLYARDKKLQATNAIKLKRNISKNLKELKADVKEYRKIIKDVVYGDKRLVRTALQNHKDLQSQLQDSTPPEAHVVVFQDYNLRKKQLDKLMYLKEKKQEEICRLRMEHAELSGDVDLTKDRDKPEVQQERREQELIARYHDALAKGHAAKSIGETYHRILVILRKDSKYFDGVLNALREDQKIQCDVIYNTTLMGQLTCESLDDARQIYKKMAYDVWINMKERERTLDIARKKAEDVWEYAKSLVRIESDTNLAKKKPKVSLIDIKLENEIKKFEQIFNTMKESMLIRSYEELFMRLEDQMKQKVRLSNLHKSTLKERNYILNKKNHAELMLRNLEHSVISTTTRYKTEKAAMLEKIEVEKKREEENKKTIESRGELLMKIRVALQNMASILACIKATKLTGKGKDKKAAREAKEAEENEEGAPKTGKTMCDDPIENEGLAVLTQVTRKAMALLASTNFELNPVRAQKAKDMYENYIAEYQSNLKFGGEEPEQTGIYFEHEAMDTDVLTRTDIKIKSKQIVEIHTREDD